MSRHSRQGSDDSPGQLGQGICQCSACSCPCSCRRERQDLTEIDTDVTLVDSDSDSIFSEEPEDINQPSREPTPGLQALEAQSRHLQPFLRYPQALPSHMIRDEAAWVDLVQYLVELEHIRQTSQSPGMEASFVPSTSSYSHEESRDFTFMHGSMVAEAGSRSPFSSMESSMYFSITSSRQSSGSPLPSRSNSSAVLEGIGSLFEQPNFFITSPLQLAADPQYCYAFMSPTRSLSMPVIKVEPLGSVTEAT